MILSLAVCFAYICLYNLVQYYSNNSLIVGRWIALCDCILIGTLASIEILFGLCLYATYIYAGFCMYDTLIRLANKEIRKYDYILHHLIVIILVIVKGDSYYILEGTLWLFGDSLAWVYVLCKHYNVCSKYYIHIFTFQTIYFWIRCFWAISLVYRAINMETWWHVGVGSGFIFLTAYWAVVMTHKYFKTIMPRIKNI